MGRQVQLRTTETDNDNFRDFLSSNYECKFYQSFAPTIEQLSLTSFSNTYHKNYGIKIHFTEFEWEPIFLRTSTKENLFYISNTSIAPVIEFSKTNWDTKQDGRIYWSKYFTGTPEYDIDKFEITYNEIVKWLQKNSPGQTKYSSTKTYFLKDAWERHKSGF